MCKRTDKLAKQARLAGKKFQTKAESWKEFNEQIAQRNATNGEYQANRTYRRVDGTRYVPNANGAIVLTSKMHFKTDLDTGKKTRILTDREKAIRDAGKPAFDRRKAEEKAAKSKSKWVSESAKVAKADEKAKAEAFKQDESRKRRGSKTEIYKSRERARGKSRGERAGYQYADSYTLDKEGNLKEKEGIINPEKGQFSECFGGSYMRPETVSKRDGEFVTPSKMSSRVETVSFKAGSRKTAVYSHNPLQGEKHKQAILRQTIKSGGKKEPVEVLIKPRKRTINK